MTKQLLLLCFIVGLLTACNDDVEHKRVLMDDGTVIYLENDNVTHYATEQDLVAVYGNHSLSRDLRSTDSVDYVIRTDSVYGYTDISTEADWSIATFGDWITQYGLKAGEKYYVRSVVEVQKQLPCYSGEQITSPPFYSGELAELMGYNTQGNRGYSVSSIRDNEGYFVGVTLATHIAYNESGKTINTYYPVTDLSTLKWKYKVLSIDWD